MKKSNNVKVGVISLGCDKNRVDTEFMLAELKKFGAEITNDVNNAEVIIINTCAFIDAAKKESIETIFEMAEYKKSGQCKKIIVTGCMPQRYFEELKLEIPEIDGLVGTGNYKKIWQIINSDCKVTLKNSADETEEFKDRYLTTENYAYLKVAEGCDNRCTFCAIPNIRGRYRSYNGNNLIYQAQNIADEGIKELILVAQNVGDYGKDLNDGSSLLKLLDKLCKLDFKRIRLMYLYPESITDDLVKYISENPKVCKYMDIPLQHISDNILKLMGRKKNGEQIRKLLDSIRNIDSTIAIRSTFITGFPQETDKDFQELKSFLQEYKLDNCGFFTYSKEEGTAAARLKGHISARIKNQRLKELIAVQSSVISKNSKKYINKNFEVLYEGLDYDKQMFFGRTEFMAPDIDGKVFFKSDRVMQIGNYYNVKINGMDKINLIGEENEFTY